MNLTFQCTFLDQELISYRYPSRCCFCSCSGDLFKKSLRLGHFKPDWDELLQECSSNKYALIDGVWTFDLTP